MKSSMTLPHGYKEIMKVDLSGNKRLFIFIQLLSLLLGALVIAIPFIFGFAKEAFLAIFDTSYSPLINYAILLLGMIFYIILHELVHGIFMRAFSKARIKYGFKIFYAYAGCDAYFAKRPYVIIALAPIVILGILLLLLNLFLPISYFWSVYLIQVLNVSGAAGDIYVTARFAGMSKDILVKDTGTSMTVYSKD